MARHLLLTSISLALLFSINHQANAQDQKLDPTRQEMALAAGYKATVSYTHLTLPTNREV